jgi:hypothetical protein
MHQRTLFLIVAMAFVAAPQFALADGDGAVTGVVGGAVAGAVVGGPVGAVVGRRNRKWSFGTRSAAMRHAHYAKDK